MAPPRIRRRVAAANNPSTVLIVFLVFFILLSIGLGVWGYLGQKKAGDMEKKAQEANKAKNDETLTKDWYKLQGLWAKAAAGYDLSKDESNDLNNLLTDFDNNKFPDVLPNKAGVKTMIATDKKELNWKADTKSLANTYRKEMDRLKRDNSQLVDDKKKLDDKLTAAEARERTRDQKNEAFQKRLQEQTDDINKAALRATREANDAKKEAHEAKVKNEEKSAEEIKKRDEQIEELTKKNEKTAKEKDEKIVALEKKLQQIQTRQEEEKAAKVDLLAFESPRGKVLRVDRTGRMPFISLGRSDRAKEQLTFSIFGMDSSGKPAKQPKGTLEIVKVLGPHLSQARVTSLRDPGAEPVQEGDQLYNAAWDPNHQVHVAIGGLVDFAQDEYATKAEQERNLKEFVDYLESQNVIVDAYVDPSDGTIKGKGVTLNTDYFILGTMPVLGKGGESIDLKDEKVDYTQKISSSTQTLRKEANQKGVTVVPLRKFAVMTGYQIPRSSRTGGGSTFRLPPKEKKKKASEPKKKKDEDAMEDEGKKDEADKEGDKKGEEKKNGKKNGKKKDEDEKE